MWWRARKKLRGCIYARYSSRFQQSIEDQIRECLKRAEAEGIEVLQEHIFFDKAKSGRSRRRRGLQEMLATLERGEVEVVLTFATNRLNRRIHLALKFVEEVIVEKRRRCIFVAQNIDTANTQFWKQLLYVFAMLDEFQTQMTVSHIRAGQIGLLLKRFVHGTYSFGYRGEVVPGEFTKKNKPRRRWVIDPEGSPWVLKIFDWYVNQKLGFSQIARRLRKDGAPPPPKVERWTRNAVRHVLMNRRYIGDWSYGWREVIWQSSADYARQFKRDKPMQEHHEEALRIVDDLLFYKAQERIAK
ncbi:MAG TPA: recombinase family protein, partial [Roseimicrobium sp.]|nr:recombinase family protein [Roseimicrobium sp.]